MTATPAPTIEELSVPLREQLLDNRRRWLRSRRPKSPYIENLRRDLRSGRKKAIEFLLAISFADVDDGLAPGVAAQPYLAMIALLEARAQAKALARGEPIVGPDPLALVDRESGAQAEKDAAEREWITEPMSPDAMQRVLEAAARYDAENDRLITAVRSRLARVTLTGRTLQAI